MKNWKTILAMTAILILFSIGAVLMFYLKTDYVKKWDISTENDESVYACLTYASGSSKNDIKPYYNLSIKGTGVMRPFTVATDDDGYMFAPWYSNYKDYIKKVEVTEDVSYISCDAFRDMSVLETVVIDSAVVDIGKGAFANCVKLNSLQLGRYVESVGQQAFVNCSILSTITVENKNTLLVAEDNILYDKNKTTLMLYAPAKENPSFDMPQTVTKILDCAFYNAKKLNTITLSSLLSNIPQYAFYSSGLTSLSIPNGVTSIDSNAFANNASLSNITFGIGLTTISSNAFNKCTSLTELKLPASVQNIGTYSFYECTKLAKIYLENKVELIGEGAFSKCTVLKDIYLNNATIVSSLAKINDCGNIVLNATNIYVTKTIIDGGTTVGGYIATSFNKDETPITENSIVYYKYIKA